jgi:short subunit dehydrogenase-like uncharacterized protein
MPQPQYDLIVFGATSFVGQILSQYLVDTYGVDGDVRWAAAGRSLSKLEALKGSLGEGAVALPLIAADASDETALQTMCDKTRVVISTVGPYALYGEPLVKICAESGTDYCDLTGEVQWIRQMVTKYEAKAKASGARIVHCCGFDSIPSDMGVYFLQQQAQEQFGEPCIRVKMRVKAIKGEASGGTVASLMNVVKEAGKSPALRKELANPYSVCPEGYGSGKRQPDVKTGVYDDDFSVWIAPFVMAAINTRIVQRSNALFDNAYGVGFEYDEAMITGKGMKGWAAAQGMTIGLGGFMLASAIKPTRWLLERFVVPAPGEGPSPEAQKNGYYDLRFIGKTADGRLIKAKVTGDQDPGYGSTAKMLGQAGLCLAQDFPKTEKEGGFWTPSTMFGDKLIERLVANAGLTFEVK